jgi:hypothetical protein
VAFRDRDGNPGLSWRVAILKYIEQEALYKQFHLDEPWDSPHNKRLIPLMPKFFLRPTQLPSPDGLTHYLAVTGKGSAFDENNSLLLDRGHVPQPGMQIGLSVDDLSPPRNRTILVVTAKAPVPWTKPEDFDCRAGPIIPRLDTEYGGTTVLLGDADRKFLRNLSEREWWVYMMANRSGHSED